MEYLYGQTGRSLTVDQTAEEEDHLMEMMEEEERESKLVPPTVSLYVMILGSGHCLILSLLNLLCLQGRWLESARLSEVFTKLEEIEADKALARSELDTEHLHEKLNVVDTKQHRHLLAPFKLEEIQADKALARFKPPLLLLILVFRL